MEGILNILLVIHLLIAAGLVGLVLMQKSEGGALGIGGSGGGGGGFLTGRGTANLLTRTTAILALCFFITSMSLAYFSNSGQTTSRFQDTPAANQPATNQPAGTGGVLDRLNQPGTGSQTGTGTGSGTGDGGGGLAPLPSLPR